MICWGKEQATRANRIGEIAATAVMVFFALYLCGHIIAAWLRGSVEVIAR